MRSILSYRTVRFINRKMKITLTVTIIDKSFYLLLLLFVLLEVDGAYRGCRFPPSVDVDEKWLRRFGAEGFYVPMSSVCDNCETRSNFNWMTVLEVKPDEDYEDKLILKPREVHESVSDNGVKSKRSINQDSEMCWNYEAITKNRGPVNITLHCEIKGNHIGNQKNCKSNDEFDLTGMHVITRTDNTTYFAGHTCFTGKENFFWVGYLYTELPKDLKHMLDKHFRSFGFTVVDSFLAKEGKSPFKLKMFRIVDCKVK